MKSNSDSAILMVPSPILTWPKRLTLPWTKFHISARSVAFCNSVLHPSVDGLFGWHCDKSKVCTQIGTLFKARVLSCMASRPLKSHHFSRLISWARLISASLLNTPHNLLYYNLSTCFFAFQEKCTIIFWRCWKVSKIIKLSNVVKLSKYSA